MTVVFPPRLTGSAWALRATAELARLGHRAIADGHRPSRAGRRPTPHWPKLRRYRHPHLGIALLEAPANWLARPPYALIRRRITAMPIREAWPLRTPAFIKSPNGKTIEAMIYSDGTRLPASDAVDSDTMVLVGDLINFTTEHRLLTLDGQVHAARQYAETGRLHLCDASSDALAFGTDVLGSVGTSLPSTMVMDIGDTADG